MNNSKLVLLAHGSRDPNWCGTFETGLSTINERLDEPAELAYMEMASPALADVIRRCHQEGCRHIRVLPLFFASGRHLLHDVPLEMDSLRAELPDTRLELLDAVGEHQGFWTSLAAMIAAGVDGRASA